MYLVQRNVLAIRPFLGPRSPWDLSEAELVELEDQLLEDMEIQDMDEIEEDFDTFSELDE